MTKKSKDWIYLRGYYDNPKQEWVNQAGKLSNKNWDRWVAQARRIHSTYLREAVTKGINGWKNSTTLNEVMKGVIKLKKGRHYLIFRRGNYVEFDNQIRKFQTSRRAYLYMLNIMHKL